MTEIQIQCAVAEEMGWKATGNGCFIKGADPWAVTTHLPNYHSNANVALDAAKYMGSKGWRCVANMGLDGTWECFFTQKQKHGITPEEGDHYGAGKTLAMAICEAFLHVLGKWKD